MNLECFSLISSRVEEIPQRKKTTNTFFVSLNQSRISLVEIRLLGWGQGDMGMGLLHAPRALLQHRSCPSKEMLLEHSDVPGDLGLYITHQISTTCYLFPKPPQLPHLPFFCHLLQIFHPFHLSLTIASPLSLHPIPIPLRCMMSLGAIYQHLHHRTPAHRTQGKKCMQGPTSPPGLLYPLSLPCRAHLHRRPYCCSSGGPGQAQSP